ncbi:MAG: DNA-formamidopyrimidine glycosylase [Bacillaceae bacterium]|nr:DNA-formamidopyrimidine glycosylase [Bacillaceae bacterium]
MPELPEVETVVRTLRQLVVGKTIEDVIVNLPRIIQKPDDSEAFRVLLIGQTIEDIQRRGKFLKFILTDQVLVSHMRMEGRYGVYESGEPVEKHTHVIFRFTDGTELRYRDVRQFGTMHIFSKGEEEDLPPLNKLGPEPLSEGFTMQKFREMLSGRKTKIKPLLLNQEFLAGLGNIYVDESLFSAGIHPETEVPELTDEQIDRLYHSIRKTLQEAVKLGGSSVKSYVNGQGEMGMFQLNLQVYGRKGEPCGTCSTPIIRIVVGGRGTHLCPVCQPEST